MRDKIIKYFKDRRIGKVEILINGNIFWWNEGKLKIKKVMEHVIEWYIIKSSVRK